MRARWIHTSTVHKLGSERLGKIGGHGRGLIKRQQVSRPVTANGRRFRRKLREWLGEEIRA